MTEIAQARIAGFKTIDCNLYPKMDGIYKQKQLHGYATIIDPQMPVRLNSVFVRNGDIGVTGKLCSRMIGAHLVQIVIALLPLLELLNFLCRE